MKFSLIVSLVCVARTGCSPTGDFLDALFGVRHNVVVLFSAPTELSMDPKTFSLTTAEVVGKSSEVCVVLAGDVPGKGMESEVKRLLGGAALLAVVSTTDGHTHELRCPASSWRLNGSIVSTKEIAACVRPSCGKVTLPLGAKVQSVAISASAPVHALGAYWGSTNAYDRGN